jgi:hypothetical protein
MKKLTGKAVEKAREIEKLGERGVYETENASGFS